jgi:hypothetical protein
MAMCTCLVVGLYDHVRTLLMVMWGVSIPVLAIAIDNTYSLNDRLDMLNAAAQVSLSY